MHRAWLSIAGAVVGAGCTTPINVGTDVTWSTDFEKGNLSDWAATPGSGGSYFAGDAAAAGTSVTVTTEQAHSGRYSAKLTSVADLAEPGLPYPGGAGLYKEGQFPKNTYYSAWYFVPRAYTTPTEWAILKFRGVLTSDAGDPTELAELLDLSLEWLPSGTMTLVLSDARHQYLSSPLPDPVPVVPIAKWFQIECFYRNSIGPDGGLTIWLNGVEIYDIVRPMGPTDWVYFTPCSLAYKLSPTDAELYVDDVAMSSVRVTPTGILRVP